MKNKKGLSDIIVTLLIILLVLAAIGVVWVVVRNVIARGVNQINYDSKCLEVNLELVSFGPSDDPDVQSIIILKRTGTGDTLQGVKMVFSNPDNEFSMVLDELIDIEVLGSVSIEIGEDVVIPENSNKIEVTPYFLDEVGSERYCLPIPFPI